MRNANNVLDEFAAEVLNTPAGVGIRAPWSGALLADDDQAAAVALIKGGALGLVGKPGSYKLYLGRGRSGNPIFRLLNGWLVYALVLATYAVLAWIGVHGREEGVGFLWNSLGLALSAVGLCYFTIHARHAWRYCHLLSGLGRVGDVTRLGACTWASVTCLACVIGFGWRILQGA